MPREGIVRLTADQDDVARRRFEEPTDGYTLVDLRSGYTWMDRGVEVRFGVDNVFDEEYVNHLNA
ncbi:MAG: TonB-dependent receptor [Gemmatimonadota bacterium]|nr:TonB-dependent receptor [Gemmatimonadota bacterium]